MGKWINVLTTGYGGLDSDTLVDEDNISHIRWDILSLKDGNYLELSYRGNKYLKLYLTDPKQYAKEAGSTCISCNKKMDVHRAASTHYTTPDGITHDIHGECVGYFKEQLEKATPKDGVKE